MAADLQVAMQVYAGFLNQGWRELPIVRWVERSGAVATLLPSLAEDEEEEMEVVEMLNLSGDGEVWVETSDIEE